MNDRKSQRLDQSQSTDSKRAYPILESGRNRRVILIGACLLLLIIFAALVILPRWRHQRDHLTSYRSYFSLSVAEAAEINPWNLAVEKVKEERGEAMGRQADVQIPHQVQHYSDTRRFLATQTAEVREHRVVIPADLIELAALIDRGELAPLETVTKNYVLMGVGGTIDAGPFTIYKDGRRIPVLNEIGLEQERNRLSLLISELENEISALQKDRSGLSKRYRTRRNLLQSQIKVTTLKTDLVRQDRARLEQYYGTAEQRNQMFATYRSLESFASSFSDRNYNLEDPSDRRSLKMRMLRSLRPEAVKVLDELAGAYREAFGRPLPVTSLVRTEEYQHQLAKVNPNATLTETTPHSTGLAFDVSYRYMTSAEQSHLMAHLAALKDAGRIEVLRENRNHYHIFGFVDGARPKESLIAASIKSIGRRVAPRRQLLSHHAKKTSENRMRRSR